MSFLRHREIYPSDGGQAHLGPAPAHRLDEFPAGYSLAGCSPAEPASASPAMRSMRYVVPADNDLSANGNLSLISVSHPRGAAQTSNPHFPSQSSFSTIRCQSSASLAGNRSAKSGIEVSVPHFPLISLPPPLRATSFSCDALTASSRDARTAFSRQAPAAEGRN